MKNKSRITAALLAMAIVLLLGACAGGTNPTGTTSSADTASPAQTYIPQPTADTPDTTAPQEASTDEKPSVNYGVLNGPTGLGVVGMHMQNAEGATLNEYEITFAGAPDEMVAKLVSGEVDIAAVPTNLASTMYNNTSGGIQQLANITLGVLYIVEDGQQIQSVQDLRGKTIYATSQGAAPEYVLNYILQQNGLAEDVKVEYKSEHSELATLLAAGEVDIALLPEPFVTNVTTQKPELRVALDINDLWEQACEDAGQENSKLVMSSVVAKKDFIENNPEAVANFLQDYAASVEYVNTNPAEAAAYLEQQNLLGMKAAVAEKAIPNCSMVFITGPEMKTMTGNFLQVLLSANPKSIGGALPAEDFYHGQ